MASHKFNEMRKLSCILGACLLMTLPALAQRHRGYTASGGWHHKVHAPAPPTRTPDTQKHRPRHGAKVPAAPVPTR